MTSRSTPSTPADADRATQDPELEALASSLPRHAIRFPKDLDGADQDEEWFEFDRDGRVERLRMHDYAAIYDVPGLYEALVYRALGCKSPEHVIGALRVAQARHGVTPRDLRVLDLGAGNGVVGAHLREIGVGGLVGVDIIPEAARAAKRDRPDVYDEYVVADLSDLSEDDEKRIRKYEPNCLVTVAALGFGDIPPEAFQQALDLVSPGGWIALGVKDRFLETDDDSGFGKLVRKTIDNGLLSVQHRENYVHRRAINGDDLVYVALVARKEADAPATP